ncbi:MAG: hypothetical protein MUF01_11325 [Bryobacterales bacterium]|nr:hypothetical protein [Bryobacterales bacterium]
MPDADADGLPHDGVGVIALFVEDGDLGLDDRDGVAVGDAGSAGAVGVGGGCGEECSEIDVKIPGGRKAMRHGG